MLVLLSLLPSCVLVNRVVFQPPAVSGYQHGDDGLVEFETESKETVRGFYFAAKSPKAPVLLWSHGNAEDAAFVLPMARYFQKRGVGVLVYDYPGYGLSTGTPNERGCYEAVFAGREFLLEKGKSSDQIVALGYSVGSGPATWLAAETDVRGLVLMAPFRSIFRVLIPWKVFSLDRFDNQKNITSVAEPLLLIHGNRDQVIGFEHGQYLFDLHEGEKDFLEVEGAGHDDLWTHSGEEIADRIIEFVN